MLFERLPYDHEAPITKRDIGTLNMDAFESMASSADAVSAIIKTADQSRLSPEELKEIKDQVDAQFRPSFAMKPKNVDSLRAVASRYIVGRGGEWYCTLCSKYCTETHWASGEHIARFDEMAAADEMLGPCSADSLRRFSPSPGFVGRIPTKGGIRRFWGEQVDNNMVQLLHARLRAGASVEVRWGGKGRRSLKAQDIGSVGMGVVSYPGSGRYRPDTNPCERFVRWVDLPDEEDPSLELVEPIPQHSGWWPALQVAWHNEAEEHGIVRRDYFARQQTGCLTVYVVCWYQLADGTWILVAWPVRLGRFRSRM